MPRRNQEDGVYVATVDFMCDIDGQQEVVYAGRTRVRAGHKLLERYAENFQPVDTGVHYEVEQATASPGEKRGVPAA